MINTWRIQKEDVEVIKKEANKVLLENRMKNLADDDIFMRKHVTLQSRDSQRESVNGRNNNFE